MDNSTTPKTTPSPATPAVPTPASATAPSADAAPTEEKELSAKDLKALKKAEKAAKRAAQKAATGRPVSSDPRQAKQGNAGGPAPQAGGNTQNQGQKGPKGNQQGSKEAVSKAGSIPTSAAAPKSKKIAKKPTLFGHLESAGNVSTSTAKQEVHPSILYLAMQFSSFHVCGSAERCRAMLKAFQDVIQDYNTPEGTTLSRNLTGHLSHQIDHLNTGRPHSISMGNAIRWLKQEISNLGIDMSDAEAKEYLQEQIDSYIRVRLDYADRVIVENAVKNINDGDTVLTYASSQVVLSTLIAAHEQGKKFKVIVVDSRPLFEGKSVAKALSQAGIPTTYSLLNGLSYLLRDVKTVFVGAHAMLSNGMLYSRVGTALVAALAYNRNIPVVVLCESIKFSDRVLLDSVTFNELGSSDALINVSSSTESIPTPSPTLKNWKEMPQVNVMQVLYDVTPPDFIKKVITEVGSLPPSSVPVVLREYKSGY